MTIIVEDVKQEAKFVPFKITVVFENEKDVQDWKEGLVEALQWNEIDQVVSGYATPVNRITHHIKKHVNK